MAFRQQDDPYAQQRINAQKDIGLAQAAAHENAALINARATVGAAGLHAAPGLARVAQEGYQSRVNELGDPTGYGGGRVNLAAASEAAPVVPTGRGPETGTWEEAGGDLAAAAPGGTFNRPAHREVVGTETGPVHIIKGTRSSYAGGIPGETWATPMRAGQAINRATGQGEYVPPPADKVHLAQAAILEEQKGLVKEQTGLAKQGLIEAQTKSQQEQITKNISECENRWKGQFAKPVPKSSGAGYDYTMPTDEGTIKDFMTAKEVAKEKGPDAALQHYEDSQNFRKYEALITPKTLEALRTSLPPEEQGKTIYSEPYLNAIRQHPQAWRETVLKIGPHLQKLFPAQPKIGLWDAAKTPSVGP